MIIQVFSNSMIFPCMELLLVIFQVFHDFQSLWEPCYINRACIPIQTSANWPPPILLIRFNESRGIENSSSFPLSRAQDNDRGFPHTSVNLQQRPSAHSEKMEILFEP